MVVREEGGYQYATKRALDAVKSKRANLAAVQEGSRPGLLSLQVAEQQVCERSTPSIFLTARLL